MIEQPQPKRNARHEEVMDDLSIEVDIVLIIRLIKQIILLYNHINK